jgi:hypothetical protein
MSDWTTEQLKYEWQYLYNERLALLGCFGQPTPEQHKIAKDEADKAIRKLKSGD